MIFETHVHLNDIQYQNDLNDVIKRAKDNNVTKMVVVGYDLKSSKKAIELANEYEFIFASIGIHPSEDKTNYLADLKEIEKLICSKVVAIGEIGLDYHYKDYKKDNQKELFIKQLELANKYNLPIIIHSRDACLDTYNILNEYSTYYSKGVMHCYSYSYEMAKEYIKLGLMLGIGGVITYKNAKSLVEVVEKISLNNFVLETDAPYLSPSKHRGERNEPSYLDEIVDKISKIKNIDREEVELQTYKNACDLLGVSRET